MRHQHIGFAGCGTLLMIDIIMMNMMMMTAMACPGGLTQCTLDLNRLPVWARVRILVGSDNLVQVY